MYKLSSFALMERQRLVAFQSSPSFTLVAHKKCLDRKFKETSKEEFHSYQIAVVS